MPVTGAALVDDDLIVAHSKQMVKDAPRTEAAGALSEDEESELYAYYGRATTTTGTAGADDVAQDDRRRGDTGDDAMTRSEEEVDVSTRTQETGRVRLRKWVEAENVQMTVPLRREKARLVTEPITDANIDDALSEPDLTSAEHEVVLHEEVVDVEKRVVPKERVRLETDVETGEQTVDEEVRKERVELVQDVDPDTRR